MTTSYNAPWRRLPIFLQHQAAECGLVCLAMVAVFHRRIRDADEMRASCDIGRHGWNIENLADIAEQFGLQSRALQISYRELTSITMPCILHWGQNHWVVCRKVGKGGITLHDPAQGVRYASWSEVEMMLSGYAIELIPHLSFERTPPQPKLRVDLLIRGIPKFRLDLASLAGMAVGLELVSLLTPYYMQLVIDHVLVTGDLELLNILALAAVFLLVLQIMLTTIRNWRAAIFSRAITRQVFGQVFDHLMRLPPAYFMKRQIGDLVGRFDSLSVLTQAFTRTLVEVGLDIVVSAAVVAMMFVYSPKLAIIVLMVLALMIVVKLLLVPIGQRLASERTFLASRRQTHLIESLRGILPIKMAKMEKSRDRQWLSKTNNILDRELSMEGVRIASDSLFTALGGIVHICVIYIAARMILSNEMSAGMLFAFLAYQQNFFIRCASITDKCLWLSSNRVHFGRVGDIVFTPKEQHVNYPPKPVDGASSLRVLKASFKHTTTDPFIFTGLNLEVRPGEIVVITGPSGCGKTTLLWIISGIYTMTDGELWIDNYLVRTGFAHQFRSRISIVFQGDELFEGTIEDNISQFSRLPDSARIEQCAKASMIHGDILAMPLGYKTRLGEQGSGISGGQRQRLAIARALYSAPTLLLLDEATSQLDVENESKIIQNIRRFGMTVIMSAHRPSATRQCDRVIDMRFMSEGIQVCV